MALTTLAPLVSSIAGPIGNILHQATIGGTSIKATQQRRHPGLHILTPTQARFRRAVAAWHALTDANRRTWEYYAQALTASQRGATTANVSAYRAFLRTNLCRLLTSQPIATLAPTTTDQALPVAPMVITLVGLDADYFEIETPPWTFLKLDNGGNQPYTTHAAATLLVGISGPIPITHTPKRPVTQYLTSFPSPLYWPDTNYLRAPQYPAITAGHYAILSAYWLTQDGRIGPTRYQTLRKPT